MSACREKQLYVIGVREKRIGSTLKRLTFNTTHGDFDAVVTSNKNAHRGVVMLGGRGGGFDGPDMLYPELVSSFHDLGIASMRIDYRMPFNCAKCAVDALLAVQYLYDEGIRDTALIGWSSGGAVALAAASVAKTVRGVAAISALRVPDCCTRRLRDKPVLLIHGDADKQSPLDTPRRIVSKSEKTRELIIYPGADHEMSGARKRLCEDLTNWVTNTLPAKRAAA